MSADSIRQIFRLQQERVKVYAKFDKGYTSYLTSQPRDFVTYRQLVNDVTQEFNKISRQIRAAETELTKSGQSDIALLVRNLQEEEKRKLELTARSHIAKQEAADAGESWEESDVIAQLTSELRRVVEKINECLDEIKYEAEDLLVNDDE
ncbi:required for excision 1-B domain-containing protein-like [Oscarella lobularis]|uniref:required for excision 1-B domain-containing protein-like n=1 Tax=Oscarella lobularis TaxID=121494 RepID=UPI003313CE91